MKKKSWMQEYPELVFVLFIGLIVGGILVMRTPRCREDGCWRSAAEDRIYCEKHFPRGVSYSYATSKKSSDTESKKSYDSDAGDNCKHVNCSRECIPEINYCYDHACAKMGKTLVDNYLAGRKPVKKSTGSNNSKYFYDPYDVYDYDDPDDFADEWAEEFGDDFEDGYDDAYDYWEDNY